MASWPWAIADEKSASLSPTFPASSRAPIEGAGLGTQFLRHIERTRLLVHLVDVSDASGRPDPVKDVEVILGELASFGAHLDEKPMIMVASKIDAVNKDKLADAQALLQETQAEAL